MRIGILTFHRALNYGAVLQCYALYRTLKDLGHDVEVIDYRPEYIEKYRFFFYKKDFQELGFVGKIRYILSCLLTIRSKRRVSSKFNAFIKKHIKTSNVVRHIEDIPCDYDVIFFGSDQIWSIEHSGGVDEIYFGQFPTNRAKFIAYAASVGRLDLFHGDVLSRFEEYIRVFDYLSVREKHLHDFLLEKFSIESTIACDPSILLERRAYEMMALRPPYENYVLLFCLIDEEEALSFAQKIAKQINANVIQLKAVLNFLRKRTYIKENIAPEDFLGYIQHARCVITNSFHATSFSVIFGKDFYTLRRSVNNERSLSLLNEVGLSDRFVDSSRDVLYKPVNYNGVGLKLSAYRKKSFDFILEGLK